MKQQMPFEVSDHVRVKPGAQIRTSRGTKLACWQGWVMSLECEGMVMMAWDSTPLKEMPSKDLRRYEEQGLDWTCCRLRRRPVRQLQERAVLCRLGSQTVEL